MPIDHAIKAFSYSATLDSYLLILFKVFLHDIIDALRIQQVQESENGIRMKDGLTYMPGFVQKYFRFLQSSSCFWLFQSYSGIRFTKGRFVNRKVKLYRLIVRLADVAISAYRLLYGCIESYAHITVAMYVNP